MPKQERQYYGFYRDLPRGLRGRRQSRVQQAMSRSFMLKLRQLFDQDTFKRDDRDALKG